MCNRHTGFTDNKNYWSRVLSADGFPVTGFLTGTRKGTAHTQRLQSESGERTLSRYWIDASTAWSSWIEYIQKDDFTAKGDLLIGTASNTFTALSTGTNGTFLTADNTTATGVRWSTGQNIVTLASDVVNNNATANTMQDVTGLSFSVTAGVVYRFKALIIYSAAATTTGSRWGINGPVSPTLLASKANWVYLQLLKL